MTSTTVVARTIVAAVATLGAAIATAVHVDADPGVCGGAGQPNCPQVTYVQPEYLLPNQPATVTVQGSNMEGITAVTLVPGGQPAPVHHTAPGAISLDVPGLPVGNYFFQLYLAGGPTPLVDGGGVVVDPSGGPTGPTAPRPVADASPAAAVAAPTPAATPAPTPSPQPTPVAATPAQLSAAATIGLPAPDDTTTTLIRAGVGVLVICALVEAINLLDRRRRSKGKGRGGTGSNEPAFDPAVVADGKANRFCASCGTGGAAMVRWRFENGAGLRVALCRRCR